MANRQSSKNALTVWAFLVVSDPQQADTLVDQEAWAKDAAAKNGWAISRVISGVSSGKLGPRKLTLGMIADLEVLPAEQRPHRILMIRLERLGRGDGLEAMNAFLQLRRLGIVVHTRLDGDVETNRASELLMPVLRFFIGGMENEVRRDKLVALYQRRRDARKNDPTIAISPKAAYGLRYEDGHLLPREPEADAVRFAYRLKSQGYGCHAIGKRMTMVAPPMVLRNGAVRPQKWTPDRVRRLITNQSYRGTIVDETIWYRAQRPAREVSRPVIRREYSLSGALRCECGTALVGTKGTGKKSSTFLYYRCNNYLAHDGHMKHYRSDRLEEQFVAILARLSADHELIQQFALEASGHNDLETLCQRLAELDKEHERFDHRRRTLFEALEDGALDRADFQWRLEDLRESEVEIERNINLLKREIAAARAADANTADMRQLLNAAGGIWKSGEIDDRRALAKAVGKALGGLTVDVGCTLHVGAQ